MAVGQILAHFSFSPSVSYPLHPSVRTASVVVALPCRTCPIAPRYAPSKLGTKQLERDDFLG
jgi:hypothetical protein